MPTEHEIITSRPSAAYGCERPWIRRSATWAIALLRRHVAEQQQELVAADAGDHVLAARHRLQALADLLEDEVADRVAVGVVDRLEAVEVDEQQGEPAGVGVGLGRGGGEAVLEIDARRQLRQAVDGRRGADGASRRLVVVRAGAVQRVEHRQRDGRRARRPARLRPRPARWPDRSRPRPPRPASAGWRRAGRCRCGRAQLLARLELEAEADQHRRQEEDGDARPQAPNATVARNRPGVANTEWA